MELEYANKKTELQCTSVKEANKLFGGDKSLVRSLLARIESLTAAETIKDIINQKQFRFHRLDNNGKRNLEGYFAIDVKTIKEPWRIILQPLNTDKQPYDPCNIDVIASEVRIIEIAEVSKHYE